MSTGTTVRELVHGYQREVLRGGLTPTRYGEIASELAALLGNIAEEIRDADMAYNAIYAEWLDREQKANRAKIRAELTEEYRRKREAHDCHMVTLEMIRSLRKLQDSVREEMRLTR
jgi:hypothetical protein